MQHIMDVKRNIIITGSSGNDDISFKINNAAHHGF